ncbi:MAG: glycosyltransferase [Acidobacteria bacterium]|nr:glycosyltransferase [Acidobacteriota bacterium]
MPDGGALILVPTPAKSLGDYAAIVGTEIVDNLRARAERFRGARVLHVNSTSFGGGVAELLYTLVPLWRDLGVDTEWRVIHGTEPFFHATKALHNGLQGAPVPWTVEMRSHYLTVNEDNAEAFEGDYDFVVVHDPQPAGILTELIEDRGRPKGKWIWRCHIDLTSPHRPVWEFLEPFVRPYDAAIFTLGDYVPDGFSGPEIAVSCPTIDPLSLKNIPLDRAIVRQVLRRYGIDPGRPLAVQVSRYDPWKDPLGVIDAYRIVKREVPELQLALIASMASDDPEGWEYYRMTEEHRAGDPDVFLLSNLQDVGSLNVNAFQRAADVVIQKSVREGFGLVVAEALWKGKAVVGGDVGGIHLQIEDGRSGFLVDSVEACAARLLELLRNPSRAAAMGRAGRRRVRQRFLSTAQLSDELALLERLSG